MKAWPQNVWASRRVRPRKGIQQWGNFRQEGAQLIKLRPREERPERGAPALLDGEIWQQVPVPER